MLSSKSKNFIHDYKDIVNLIIEIKTKENKINIIKELADEYKDLIVLDWEKNIYRVSNRPLIHKKDGIYWSKNLPIIALKLNKINEIDSDNLNIHLNVKELFKHIDCVFHQEGYNNFEKWSKTKIMKVLPNLIIEGLDRYFCSFLWDENKK